MDGCRSSSPSSSESRRSSPSNRSKSSVPCRTSPRSGDDDGPPFAGAVVEDAALADLAFPFAVEDTLIDANVVSASAAAAAAAVAPALCSLPGYDADRTAPDRPTCVRDR